MQSNFLSNQLHLWGDRNIHRLTSIVFLTLSLGCFCTAIVPEKPAYKALLMLLSTGFSGAGIVSHKRYKFAHGMVQDLTAASVLGYRQQATKALMPIDARRIREQEESPAQQQQETPIDDFDRQVFAVAQSGNAVAIALMETLINHGADAVPVNLIEGLTCDRYILQPRKGIGVKKIAALSKDLQIGVGLDTEPIIGVINGGIAVDVPREERLLADYEDYIGGDRHPGTAVPVGADQLTREMVWLDFEDSNTPHALVAGSTGSGKSEMLRSMAKYATENYTKEELQVFGLDVKRSSFDEFADADSFTLIEDPIKCVAALCKLTKVVTSRRDRRKGYKDIKAYNQAHLDKPMPRVLAIVEELKDCLDGLKTLSESELEQLTNAYQEIFEGTQTVGYASKEITPHDLVLLCLGRIGQAGRSEGIHLIVCTQEPDKKMLDSLIGNLLAKIGLRLNSFVEANVIMPGKEAKCDRLLGKGDLLYLHPGKPLQRCQSLWVG